MSKWWDRGISIPMTNSNFQKIIDFYLFNCPCETEKGSKQKETKKYNKVSQRAITLRAQGWTGGFLNTLLASMKKTASGHLTYQVFKEAMVVASEADKIEKESTLTDSFFEMIVMTQRNDMNKTSAILYYIRNAFAHGSFSVVKQNNKYVYFLESSKNDTVLARIRLREDTLLKWISDISLSPNTLRNALRNERKKKRGIKERGVA